MNHLRTAAVLSALTLLSVGCSMVKQPSATFQSMNVTDVNAQGFTMAFDVNVTNPNSVELPISQADYKISFADTKVLEGKANPAGAGAIPAGGTIPIKVPVTLTYENLLAAEQTIIKNGGTVRYALDGSLKFGKTQGASNMLTDITGGLNVPLKYEGVLDVKGLVQNPQALMSNPAAQKLAKQLVGSLLSH